MKKLYVIFHLSTFYPMFLICIFIGFGLMTTNSLRGILAGSVFLVLAYVTLLVSVSNYKDVENFYARWGSYNL